MKKTQDQIEEIVREEVEAYLKEAGNRFHDPDTGYFTKPKRGAVYSMSSSGARSAGISQDYVDRGTMTTDRADRTKRQLKRPADSAAPAGRQKHPSGSPITPKYSVSKYPQTYKEQLDELGEQDTILELPLDTLKGILKALIDEIRAEAQTEQTSPLQAQ